MYLHHTLEHKIVSSNQVGILFKIEKILENKASLSKVLGIRADPCEKVDLMIFCQLNFSLDLIHCERDVLYLPREQTNAEQKCAVLLIAGEA